MSVLSSSSRSQLTKYGDMCPRMVGSAMSEHEEPGNWSEQLLPCMLYGECTTGLKSPLCCCCWASFAFFAFSVDFSNICKRGQRCCLCCFSRSFPPQRTSDDSARCKTIYHAQQQPASAFRPGRQQLMSAAGAFPLLPHPWTTAPAAAGAYSQPAQASVEANRARDVWSVPWRGGGGDQQMLLLT